MPTAKTKAPTVPPKAPTAPSKAGTDHQRSYYISNNAVEKLREKLRYWKLPGIAEKSDLELGNLLDDAVTINRNRPEEDDRWLTYSYQGTDQTCVDITNYFGQGVSICAVIADNDSSRSTFKQAIITVTDGNYIDKIDTGSPPQEAPRATIGDLTALRSIKLPPLPEKPKDTMLISYKDKDGKEQYEERVNEDAQDRLSKLIDEGVPPSSIRIWKQVKTKVRLEIGS